MLMAGDIGLLLTAAVLPQTSLRARRLKWPQQIAFDPEQICAVPRSRRRNDAHKKPALEERWRHATAGRRPMSRPLVPECRRE